MKNPLSQLSELDTRISALEITLDTKAGAFEKLIQYIDDQFARARWELSANLMTESGKHQAAGRLWELMYINQVFLARVNPEDIQAMVMSLVGRTWSVPEGDKANGA